MSAAGETMRLLTTKQMAALLGTSPPTLVAWTRAGKVPAEVALGRVWRYDESKVRAALRAAAERMAGGR